MLESYIRKMNLQIPIFIPDGETKTLGNFDDNVRFKYWNMDAYYELAKYLDK